MQNCPNGHGALTNNTCAVCGYSFAPSKSSKPKGTPAIQEINTLIKKELMRLKLADEPAPWQQPWFSVDKQNFKTHHVYKGINRLLLAFTSDEFFLSQKQLASYKHATLKADARLFPVVLWLPPEERQPGMSASELAKLRNFPVMRTYKVYPSADVEGLPERKIAGEKDNAKWPDVESFVAHWTSKIKIEEVGGKAYCNHTDGVIRIPSIKRFESEEEYYRTLFHEMTHWTKTSLKRYEKDDSDKVQVREELVAEIGSAYLGSVFGIKPNKNTAAYLDYWMSKIDDDAYLLTSASQQAEKAVQYLLG